MGQGKCEGKPQDGLEQVSDENRALRAGGGKEGRKQSVGTRGRAMPRSEEKAWTGWEEASQRLPDCQDGTDEHLHEEATLSRVGP